MPNDDQDNPYRPPQVAETGGKPGVAFRVEPGRKRDGSIRQDILAALSVLTLVGLALGLDHWICFPCGTLPLAAVLLLIVWAKLRKWPRLWGLPASRITWTELAVLCMIYGVLSALQMPAVTRGPHPRGGPNPPRTPQAVPSDENGDAER